MRIKAVLRDNEILQLKPGSPERIVAVAKKNIDRVINQASLLKVMGLGPEKRLEMLEVLTNQDLHIWLAKDAEQDIIYFFNGNLPQEYENTGYQWK
jgi:hypothetical protein